MKAAGSNSVNYKAGWKGPLQTPPLANTLRLRLRPLRLTPPRKAAPHATPSPLPLPPAPLPLPLPLPLPPAPLPLPLPLLLLCAPPPSSLAHLLAEEEEESARLRRCTVAAVAVGAVQHASLAAAPFLSLSFSSASRTASERRALRECVWGEGVRCVLARVKKERKPLYKGKGNTTHSWGTLTPFAKGVASAAPLAPVARLEGLPELPAAPAASAAASAAAALLVSFAATPAATKRPCTRTRRSARDLRHPYLAAAGGGKGKSGV